LFLAKWPKNNGRGGGNDQSDHRKPNGPRRK
jgi:hypothetical protein